MIKPCNQNLSEPFNAITLAPPELREMENYTGLQNIGTVFALNRLLRCVAKIEGTLQGITDVSERLTYRITLPAFLTEA